MVCYRDAVRLRQARKKEPDLLPGLLGVLVAVEHQRYTQPWVHICPEYNQSANNCGVMGDKTFAYEGFCGGLEIDHLPIPETFYRDNS